MDRSSIGQAASPDRRKSKPPNGVLREPTMTADRSRCHLSLVFSSVRRARDRGWPDGDPRTNLPDRNPEALAYCPGCRGRRRRPVRTAGSAPAGVAGQTRLETAPYARRGSQGVLAVAVLNAAAKPHLGQIPLTYYLVVDRGAPQSGRMPVGAGQGPSVCPAAWSGPRFEYEVEGRLSCPPNPRESGGDERLA